MMSEPGVAPDEGADDEDWDEAAEDAGAPIRS